ncbi:fungal-specific transcription factor domain-containing protein [Biscogniauxia sp. FL1348]|nr:fungal-specific transcription factor domain-containing protein [Biscogniauxia sp. FL1348]
MAAMNGANSDTIPPIEIGTFVASRPDKSEFIGSSSGVFFIDTVLRAFATSDQVGDRAGAPDPRALSSFLAAPDCHQDEPPAELNPAPEPDLPPGPGRWTYDVDVPGLGSPPSPDLARSLLVQYFQTWHPLFPFLHGPTFFDQVNQFYDDTSEHSSATSSPRPNLGAKICRAVTFQCIFNIAASVRGQPELGPESLIRSPSALTSLLGLLSSEVDSSSLQALIAAELYLMSIMSLRAASTIHGTLTRLIYHAGYHRCPLRYVQLPHHTCEIRKRIFWCAYVLDRHSGDSDVDVCIPAMVELHRPVRTGDKPNAPRSAPEDEIRAHFPNSDHSHSTKDRQDTLEQPNTPLSRSSATAVSGSEDSPAEHHVGSARRASEYVLGYLATYSRLAGEILDLLHKSLHSRKITRDKILEVTTRAHAWWNSLPSALQECQDSDVVPTEQRYDILFTLLYSNLIILINRPFLSLPIDRVDFRSCLQTALSASRDVILKTKNHSNNALLTAWPGTLSITWMSGLVSAFASLLGLYPFAKASSDIEHCLKLLELFGTSWASARRCHAALKALLDKLSSQSHGGIPDSTSTPVISRQTEDGQDQSMVTEVPMAQNPDAAGMRMVKRRRLYNDTRDGFSIDEVSGTATNTNPSNFLTYMPVLEYTGPDFGFDAARTYDQATAPQSLYDYQLNPDSGLFSNAGWDLYINNFDNGFGF